MHPEPGHKKTPVKPHARRGFLPEGMRFGSCSASLQASVLKAYVIRSFAAMASLPSRYGLRVSRPQPVRSNTSARIDAAWLAAWRDCCSDVNRFLNMVSSAIQSTKLVIRVA